MASDICRLCISDSHPVHNIFECDIDNLAEKILECTVVEISRDDELPKGACSSCVQMVVQFHFFRKQCQNSNAVLKQKYSKNVGFKNEAKYESDDYVMSRDAFKCKLESTPIIKNTRSLRSNQILNDETKKCLTNNEPVADTCLQYSSGDDDMSTHSNEICDDDNYRPPSEVDFCAKDGILTPAPKCNGTLLRKKKCKIKRAVVKQEQDNVGHHLVYTEKDYAILGRERKVRIYEMDNTMREIIGHNIYTCEICTMEFCSFFEYYDHQETHNGELVFRCSKCGEVFSKRQNLVEHDARHKIPCKICELEVLPKSMSAHLLIHTDVHKCPDCGMRHTSNASLEKHIKARHTGIKGFVCHVCGKQSSCQSSMNRHMAYHSNERPYKCKYCDFCAKSLNIVQVHTSRKHFAEKCVCEICAKLFKSQPSLVQHMKRIHTARKHICDICGKAFIERYNLNRHLKKHAGQRLHECKICHKEFFTIRKLKEHMHSHRQGCVNCPKCGKEFFYKKYYTKHVVKCTVTESDKIAANDSTCMSLINSISR